MNFIKVNSGDYVNVNQIKTIQIISYIDDYGITIVRFALVLVDNTIEYVFYDFSDFYTPNRLKEDCDKLGLAYSEVAPFIALGEKKKSSKKEGYPFPN